METTINAEPPGAGELSEPCEPPNDSQPPSERTLSDDDKPPGLGLYSRLAYPWSSDFVGTVFKPRDTFYQSTYFSLVRRKYYPSYMMITDRQGRITRQA